MSLVKKLSLPFLLSCSSVALWGSVLSSCVKAMDSTGRLDVKVLNNLAACDHSRALNLGAKVKIDETIASLIFSDCGVNFKDETIVVKQGKTGSCSSAIYFAQNKEGQILKVIKVLSGGGGGKVTLKSLGTEMQFQSLLRLNQEEKIRKLSQEIEAEGFSLNFAEAFYCNRDLSVDEKQKKFLEYYEKQAFNVSFQALKEVCKTEEEYIRQQADLEIGQSWKDKYLVVFPGALGVPLHEDFFQNKEEAQLFVEQFAKCHALLFLLLSKNWTENQNIDFLKGGAHLDLHKGNIFVGKKDGKTVITWIDLEGIARSLDNNQPLSVDLRKSLKSLKEACSCLSDEDLIEKYEEGFLLGVEKLVNKMPENTQITFQGGSFLKNTLKELHHTLKPAFKTLCENSLGVKKKTGSTSQNNGMDFFDLNG